MNNIKVMIATASIFCGLGLCGVSLAHGMPTLEFILSAANVALICVNAIIIIEENEITK